MYRDLLELARQIEQRVDKRRAPYVAIAAGVVYLIAFNTVLRTVDVWYFAFMALVLAVCLPFVLTEETGKLIWVAARGFLKRKPRVALFLAFVTHLFLVTVLPGIFASRVVTSAITAITAIFCVCLVRIQLRKNTESAKRPSALSAGISKYTFLALTAIAGKIKSALGD